MQLTYFDVKEEKLYKGSGEGGMKKRRDGKKFSKLS
jgi:hypothetical protein